MQTKKFERSMRKFGTVFKKKLKQLMVVKKLNIVQIFKKNRFESDDDLPMNKSIKLHLMTIIIRCVFSEDKKFYPQLFLDDPLYELVQKCYSTKKFMFQKGLM